MWGVQQYIGLGVGGHQLSSYKPVTDSTGNAHAQLGLGFTSERER